MMLSAKVAVNPLPWVLGPDGFDLSPATVAAAMAGQDADYPNQPEHTASRERA